MIEPLEIMFVAILGLSVVPSATVFVPQLELQLLQLYVTRTNLA